MGRFFGREKELNALNEFYESDTTRACSIFGRRRIGKTVLIEEFVKDKNHIFIQFLNSSIDANLRHLSMIMGKYMQKDIMYKSSEEFFSDLSDITEKQKMVIVFDEYPHILSNDDSFASNTQNMIDHNLHGSKLVICGSSISTMIHETSDRSCPLYGRTMKMRIDKMRIEDCIKFHPMMSDEDQLKLYLLLGGIPYYYDVDEVRSYDEYLVKYLLPSNSRFNEEGVSMIYGELSPAKEYIKILDAMTGRNNTVKTISDRSGIDRTTCAYHLDDLVELGYVIKCNPMMGAPKKPVRYRIVDNMLAFHFLVLRNIVCEYNNLDGIIDTIQNQISTFNGLMFEDYCRDMIRQNYPVKEIGAWWGAVRSEEDGETENYEIDIVAETVARNNVIDLFAECKFSRNEVGFSALNQLESSMCLIKERSNARKMIISVSGFKDDLVELSDGVEVLLVGLDILVGKEKWPLLNR